MGSSRVKRGRESTAERGEERTSVQVSLSLSAGRAGKKKTQAGKSLKGLSPSHKPLRYVHEHAHVHAHRTKLSPEVAKDFGLHAGGLTLRRSTP